MQQVLFDIGEVVARLEPGLHGHEADHRSAIDANWASNSATNPALFNGPTVLGTQWAVEGDRLGIRCRKTDYATLIHWLATPGSQTSVGIERSGGAVHFFANAVMTGSDGRVVMGRMAGQTYNAGKVYMPSGSFDPEDFSDGQADFHANMQREVAEETGIDLGMAQAGQWSAVAGRGLIAVFRLYRFEVAAAELAEQARDWLSTEGDGELAEILTFAPGDIHSDMPGHVRLFMEDFQG